MAAFADAIRGGVFLSTLPARGATGSQPVNIPLGDISIHAPREGSDAGTSTRCAATAYFYPRSPRGERLQHLAADKRVLHISIHAPREGSDQRLLLLDLGQVVISIHAPREGSDIDARTLSDTSRGISIHAPREGSDLELGLQGGDALGISIHAPREGSDPTSTGT